jgi:L-alanine-DL-glutamate epimerase-like enolase superfamily enzyme
VTAALGQFKPVLERADPFSLESIEANLNRVLRGNASAKSAVSSALHDLIGKRLGLPIFRLWGLDAATVPQSSFTIAIAENHDLENRVAEARDYPILKIKLGTDRDEEIVRIVRNAAPEKRLRVDANAAWTAKHAVRMCEFLAEQGVEMVEQPVAANDIEGLRFVRKSSKLPIFADESCLVASDVAKLAGAVDGINIKLAKCGSLREAMRMVHAARALDMQVMAGCMIESSLGISAIAQISPLLDYADFDGAALLSNDPFRGTTIAGGSIRLSGEPGLGATPAPSVDLAAAFQSA